MQNTAPVLLPDEYWVIGFGTGRLVLMYPNDPVHPELIAADPLNQFVLTVDLIQNRVHSLNLDNLSAATTAGITPGAVRWESPYTRSAFYAGYTNSLSRHPRLWDGRLLAMDVRLVQTHAFLSASGYTSAEWKAITRAEVLPVSTFQRVRTACRTLLKSG